MKTFSRRSILAAGGGCAVTALSGAGSSALAHDPKAPLGSWTQLSDMPFPVQEIYPAPFWKDGAAAGDLKSGPFNIIVNAGGLTPDAPFQVTDAVTYYDPQADIWGYATPLPEPRHHLSLVNNNGFLYGIGGFARDDFGGWQMREDCWRLDAVNAQWKLMRNMPHPQAETVCVSVQGNIHVIGGRAPAGSQNREWGDHIDTGSHWLYDSAVDDWFPLKDMPTARNSAAGVVFNGVIYVFGGRTVGGGNTPVVEVYDPLSDRWEQARPMPKAQGGLAAAVMNRKIYVFGGEYFSATGGGVFADAWEYDPYKDTWRAIAAMPRPRHGLGAVGMSDGIYVMGGALRAGGEATSPALDRFEI